MGSEFKYIRVVSGIVHNGETGVASASKYEKIHVEAHDKGDVKARVRNGTFENVELQKSWFEEMRGLEERAKEREKQKKREEDAEDEATRGRVKGLVSKRGRREGELVNSGRALDFDFLQ